MAMIAMRIHVTRCANSYISIGIKKAENASVMNSAQSFLRINPVPSRMSSAA